jgi:Ca2+-binding EF-hand superfamily protein
MPQPLPSLFALSLALALAPALLTPALAQQGPSEAALHWFDSFDQNKDGILTPDEMRSVSAKQFGRIDSNGDGALSLEEYLFGIPEDHKQEIDRARTRFNIMDRNGDGRATEEEFVDFGLRVIQLGDTNGDGQLSRAEFTESVTPSQ